MSARCGRNTKCSWCYPWDFHVVFVGLRLEEALKGKLNKIRQYVRCRSSFFWSGWFLTLTSEYYLVCLQTSIFWSGFSCTKFASLRLKAMSRDTVFAYFLANVTVYTSTMSVYSSSYSSKQLCQNSTDSGKFLVEGCWRHLVSRYLFACCSAQMRTNMVYKWKWIQWKNNTVINITFVFKCHVNTEGVHRTGYIDLDKKRPSGPNSKCYPELFFAKTFEGSR